MIDPRFPALRFFNIDHGDEVINAAVAPFDTAAAAVAKGASGDPLRSMLCTLMAHVWTLPSSVYHQFAVEALREALTRCGCAGDPAAVMTCLVIARGGVAWATTPVAALPDVMPGELAEVPEVVTGLKWAISRGSLSKDYDWCVMSGATGADGKCSARVLRSGRASTRDAARFDAWTEWSTMVNG